VKAVILCAGYATRLYPLTLDCPKPLLLVGGRPLLDYILETLEEIPEIREVMVVTNAKFKEKFVAWQKKGAFSKAITILNDPSTNNENRLGAIQDLDLAITQGKIDDDILVIAGDNLFHFSIRDFVNSAKKNGPQITVACVDIESREQAQKYGVLQLDPKGRVVDFLEKPEDPPSTLVSMGLYFFPRVKLSRIKEYLKNRENPDAPGFFIRWLLDREALYGYSFKGIWYDIGDLKSYDSANKLLQESFTGKGKPGR